jgi:1,2-dihydroxy-3-keto-5-methylthiopentene dioxygenase
MSLLKIYAAADPAHCETVSDFATIAARLHTLGIRFERWKTEAVLQDDSTQEEILQAYCADVERLMAESAFQSADVVSLTPAHPDKLILRNKFLNEHIHTEDEVRFFVDGCGLFYIHLDDQVVSLLCEKGDLLSVPAQTQHWFDMGAEPFFKCIRLFTNPQGWVAQFTGDTIAQRFPTLEIA